MKKPILSLVAAVARDGGIGHRGELLVKIPEDLRRFKRLTLGSPVLMGRKTWDAIGRPLPGRQNIVISRDPAWRAEGATPAASLDAALDLCSGERAGVRHRRGRDLRPRPAPWPTSSS